MARILTGIQSTGIPHLGNILGAILPAIELSNKSENEAFYFIADLHSLTTIKDGALLKSHTHAVAAAWLAFGFNTEKNTFYRQSDVPEVTELTWYLSCFTPFPMLANAHSFKDKSDKLSDVNAGLFVYPVLQAADILLYDADIVPVGKDQQQHLEITRDIANAFNNRMGETFVVPSAHIGKDVMIVPGIDGQKMSKSYGNFINIFLDEKKLRKVVMKIVTDTIPIEEPMNPDTCTVFQLYSLVASPSEISEMRKNYLGGGFGFGRAKQALFERLLERFAEPRKQFAYFMDHPEMIDGELKRGAQKARGKAADVLSRVRNQLGLQVKSY